MVCWRACWRACWPACQPAFLPAHAVHVAQTRIHAAQLRLLELGLGQRAAEVEVESKREPFRPALGVVNHFV